MSSAVQGQTIAWYPRPVSNWDLKSSAAEGGYASLGIQCSEVRASKSMLERFGSTLDAAKDQSTLTKLIRRRLAPRAALPCVQCVFLTNIDFIAEKRHTRINCRGRAGLGLARVCTRSAGPQAAVEGAPGVATWLAVQSRHVAGGVELPRGWRCRVATWLAV